MKVVLISVIIRKKVINIVLESEMDQFFLDNIFFTNSSVIMGQREYKNSTIWFP